MKKVYITRKLPQIAEIKLKEQGYTVEVNPYNRNLSYEELIESVKGKDAIICLLSDKIDKQCLENADKAVIFANYAVGYNNMDIEVAKKRGIFLTNTPGVLTDATADLAFALLVCVARRVVEADTYLRKGNFKGWAPDLMCGMELTGKTLGVIGAGRIGTAVMKRARAFNMNIIYYSRTRKRDIEHSLNARYVSFTSLLSKSDFISLHVPLTEETYHLIDEQEFALMKKTAILINTARGPVINEKALCKALKEKKIWGAGLDVFEEEPVVSEELIGMNNVVLLPHIGSATYETREKMALIAVKNVIQALSGEIPENLIYSV